MTSSAGIGLSRGAAWGTGRRSEGRGLFGTRDPPAEGQGWGREGIMQ
jgi:hypothetical protein